MRVLVTGVTGAIGVPLVKELLKNGHEVTILARAKHSRDELFRSYGQTLTVIYGDITESVCGIYSEEIDQYIGRFDAFIHGAGKVQYYAHLRNETYLANLTGTRNALALATQLEIPQFIFLSTCYVAGKTEYLSEGEEGDIANTNNPYEASKIEAETLVRQYVGKWLILRLSTVIGHSKSGYIVNVGGYAAFVKGFWSYRSRITQFQDNPFWVAINPASTLNLVPSDWVVEMICRAIEAKMQGVLHLSHPYPVDMGFLFRETFHKHFPLPLTYNRLQMLETALHNNRTWRAIQDTIDRNIVGYFGPYVTHDTTFGHELVKIVPGYLPPPEIDEHMIRIQVRYMINYLFTKRTRQQKAA